MHLRRLIGEARTLSEDDDRHKDNFWVITTGLTAHQIAIAMGAASPSASLIHLTKGKLHTAFEKLSDDQRQVFRTKLKTFQ